MEDNFSYELAGEEFERVNAIKTLGKSRSFGSLKMLVSELRNEKKLIRHFAAEGIFELAGYLLTYPYTRSKFGVLILVAEALAETDDIRAIPDLKRMLEEAGNWKLQKEVLREVKKIGKHFPDIFSVTEKLTIITPDESEHVIELLPEETSPYVLFDHGKGVMLMKGRAYDRDNVIRIIRSLSEEFDRFESKYPGKPFVASFFFDSFYDEIGKVFVFFLDKLARQGNSIVYWYYHDGDYEMQDMGEDLDLLTHLPVRLIKIREGEAFYYEFTEKTINF